jgi:hypothetical protein
VTRFATLLVALGLALLPGSESRAQSNDELQADEHPIIAQLYSDPARYADRSITIYGLVVEEGANSTFLLQDVSQRPLKIVGSDELKAAVGDQLLVTGLFHPNSDEPYIVAKTLIPTKVVAGGGCC